MREHPVTHRPLDRPPTNVESILEIPEGYITPEWREQLLIRAEAGEDVYAYGEDRLPDGIMNVWDIDTRIALFPLERWRWELIGQRYVAESGQWLLVFKQHEGDGTRPICVWIDRQVSDSGVPNGYVNRAKRRGTMIAHYINLYSDDPSKYDNHHF